MFRPMLAGKADVSLLRWPVLASPKIDGLRVTIFGGVGYSRSQKVLPNRHFQECVRRYADILEGMDGEVVVGPANAPDVYRRSMSEIMSADGEPEFSILVFDVAGMDGANYIRRHAEFQSRLVGMSPLASPLTQIDIVGQSELLSYEEHCLSQGYEGVMLRDPMALYRQGRASPRSGELLKLKRYADAEAIVIGVQEEMHNANEAQLSETGYTKRSSHKENRHGKGRMGALVVRGVTAYRDVEFQVGSGFDAAQRLSMWESPPIGQLIKFRYFEGGSKDAPRFPVFIGFRDGRDLL